MILCAGWVVPLLSPELTQEAMIAMLAYWVSAQTMSAFLLLSFNSAGGWPMLLHKMASGSQEQGRGSPNGSAFSKPLSSYLLISHWPKQVTLPSPDSRVENRFYLLMGRATKNVCHSLRSSISFSNAVCYLNSFYSDIKTLFCDTESKYSVKQT